MAHSGVVELILSALASRERVLVALWGIPGSGKTTAAAALRAELATRLGDGERVRVLSMDGFHLYRRQLDELADPATAHRRRGAPFTFDARRFVDCVKRIRQQARGDAPLMCPTFDHALKDPCEDATQVGSDASVVIVEGLYCGLDEAPWNELLRESVFDVTVRVECELDVALERVVQRRIHEIGQDEADAREQVQANDRVNAEYVLKHSAEPHISLVTAAQCRE
jgi:pantothenate kinase